MENLPSKGLKRIRTWSVMLTVRFDSACILPEDVHSNRNGADACITFWHSRSGTFDTIPSRACRSLFHTSILKDTSSSSGFFLFKHFGSSRHTTSSRASQKKNLFPFSDQL
jgi:hypothetical protein